MNDLIYPDWKVPKFIRAIQTTRKGGCSVGRNYGKFNLSHHVGDEHNSVNLNIKQLMDIVPNDICWIEQVHGKRIIQLPKNIASSKADACYSKDKNVICAVRTADCLPILITDIRGTFVLTIHAGWRGLGIGIIEKAINKINSPNDLIVWLGPCISQENFEVGHDVYEFFNKNDKNCISAFIEKSKDKFSLSLTKAAELKLKSLGVQFIYGNGITQNYCTYNDVDKFYSYRRDKLTGRMASLLWID
jgi:YfiH family protein